MSTSKPAYDYSNQIPYDPSNYFTVTIDDGSKVVVFTATDVTWPLAYDGFVIVKVPMVPLALAQIFDEWDGGAVDLTVDIENKCNQSPYGQWECPPQDVLDYNSISGTAKVLDKRNCITVDTVDENGNTVQKTVCGGWIYNAKGKSEIPLLFSKWD